MTDLLTLLLEFYRDKLAAVLRHQAAARHVSQYDANNTYQYMDPGQQGEFDDFTFGAEGQPGGEGVNADIGNWNLR